MNWTETPSDQVGMDPSLVAAAARCAGDRLEGAGAAGQLVVLRRGQVVLDRAFGTLPRSLFLIYSTSKPYTALLVHALAQEGRLDLDQPIAVHWPDFGRRGKESMTPRHVLQHRAGVPVDRNPVALLRIADWDYSVRRMTALRPRTPPGGPPAYHPLNFGFILGELVRRVCGGPVDAQLRERFFEPLGLRDTHLGLPPELWPRAVPVKPAGGRAELVNSLLFNRRSVRAAVIPAASISAAARDVAVFYEVLRCGGELDGVRVLSERAVADARQVSSDGEIDGLLGRPVRWAQGFHLGGSTGPGSVAGSMGSLSSRSAFGHNGNACCSAWADPERELVFVYLTSLLLIAQAGFGHHGLVADCVLRACES
jgi:CubicO group peptidase (beta-lactamase class C family)